MKKFWRRSECERIRENLSSYIDERLDTLEREAIRYHLEVCDDCRQELESLKLVVGLLHRLPAAPLPRSFTLVESTKAQRKPLLHRPAFAWLRPVAVTVAILFLALLASDLAGLLTAQPGTQQGGTAAAPELTLPQREIPLPEVGAPASEEVKSPEKVSPGAPFAVEKRGLPPEAGLTPQGKESPSEELVGPTSRVSTPPPLLSPGWLRPLEVALGLLSGLLLGLLLVQRKSRPRRLA